MNQPREWLTQLGGIAEQLSRLRDAAGLSGKELAETLGWAPSKVSRIEKGRQMPSAADVDAWARAVGVDASAERELLDLLAEAQDAQRSWRRRLRLGHAADQARYTDLVEASTTTRHFETVYVPGLLQTPEYARRILTESYRLHRLDPTDLEDAVRERMARQRWLYDPSKRFEFLLAEPVLRWRLCPTVVMRGQLDRLQTVIGVDNIRFGILPLDVEIATTPQNSFVMYDDLVLVESFTDEKEYTGEDAERYVEVFEAMWAEAATGPDARRLIVAASNALP